MSLTNGVRGVEQDVGSIRVKDNNIPISNAFFSGMVTDLVRKLQ